MKKPKKLPTTLSPTSVAPAPAQPSTEEIAALAYFLWENEGRPDGRDMEHWLQAEISLRQTRAQPTLPPSP